MKLVPMPVKVQSCSCGSAFTILLCEHGALYSYGLNEKGQLGLGDWK